MFLGPNSFLHLFDAILNEILSWSVSIYCFPKHGTLLSRPLLDFFNALAFRNAKERFLSYETHGGFCHVEFIWTLQYFENLARNALIIVRSFVTKTKSTSNKCLQNSMILTTYGILIRFISLARHSQMQNGRSIFSLRISLRSLRMLIDW